MSDTTIVPLAYSPAEAGKALGLSRSRVYELMNDGSLPSIRIGGSRRIRHEALVAFLDGLEDAS